MALGRPHKWGAGMTMPGGRGIHGYFRGQPNIPFSYWITKWAAGSDEGWRDGRVRSPGWERVPALHVFLSTAGSQC